MNRTKFVVLLFTSLVGFRATPVRAELARFSFTGTTFSTFGVPNAGTTVSGYVTFDPFVLFSGTCGPDCGDYPQSAPATFFFTTNAGFTLQQTLTNIHIADKFANGITDYYVFDADVGTFSASTNFSRLELTLSNNHNPFIPNINVPTTAPDFSAFQFHTVAFFGFTGNTASQRVEANLTSLTAGAQSFAYVANFGSNNVSAYTINPANGALTAVPGTPFAAGSGPISVTVDPAGKFAYVANQNSNNVSAYSINPANGALTAVPGSPFAAGSGPGSVTVDPTGKFAYVANQDVNNVAGNVSAYTINPSTGALTAVPGSPFAAGKNPFSVAVDPTGKFAYVTNAFSINVSAYAINSATGALTAVPGSPFSAGSNPFSVIVEPTGKFAYVANLNSNDVSAYTIDPSTGALTPIPSSPFAEGGNPRSVTVDPTGKFAYVVGGGSNVLASTINSATGALAAVSGSPFPAGNTTFSVTVDSTGKFVYVANGGSNDVSAYTIDPSTGALTAVPGSPFAAGTQPVSVVTTSPGTQTSPPSLVSASFFGGPGDQTGHAIAIQGNGVYVGGYSDGPLARYLVPVLPGAVPVWSRSLSGAQFYGIATTSSTVYPVGNAIPPACGAADGVGDTEGKSIWALYDSVTGNLQGCQSTNYFPYRGGENLGAAVQASSYIYAAGTAETCGFGNNTFLLSKFDLTGVLLQTAVEAGVTLGQFNCIGDSHSSGLALLNNYLYVAGGSKLSSEDGVLRPVLMKYGTDLTRQWKARPADQAGNFNAATAFGGAIYAVGSVAANGGDFLIEKYDEAGNRIWSRTSGGAGDDELFGVVGIGSRIYAVGFTTSQGAGGQDVVILEIDPISGLTRSTTLYGGALDDAAYGAATDGTDLYVVGGSKSFASAAGNVVGQSDLVLLRYSISPVSISKSDGGLHFQQGQQNAHYTITVHNGGSASTAGTLTVTDVLQAGLTPAATAGTGTDWSCSSLSSTIACTSNDSIAPGSDYPLLTLNVNVSSSAATSLQNQASVSGGGFTNSVNSNTTTTTVDPVPDLTISKTHTGNLVQGFTATYPITVHNIAAGSATTGQVTVTDTPPVGFTYNAGASTLNGWACGPSGGQIVCTITQIVNGGSDYPVLTLALNIPAGASGNVTNSVQVSGGGESNTDNNSASDSTAITQLPDLTITKAHVGVAQNFNDGYEGPSIGPSWTTTQQFGAIAVSSDQAHTGSQSAKFTSAPGGQRNLFLTHQFSSATRGDFSVYFYDVAPGQQTLYEKLYLSNSAQPNLQASIGTQDFDANCYSAAVTNAAGTSFGQNANCGVFPQLTTTNVARTAGWHLFKVSVTATGITLFIDGAQLFTAAGDYSFDQAVLGVSGPSFRPDTTAYFDDFSWTNNTAFIQGQQGQYSLVVSNGGGSATTGPVTVTDTLPTGVTYVSTSSPQWSCSANGQMVSCDYGNTIGAGSSAQTLTLNVNVSTSAGTPLTNSATVACACTESNTGNNTSSTDSVDVTPIIHGPSSALYMTGVNVRPVPGCDTSPTAGAPVNVNEIQVIQGGSVINSWVTHTASRAYPSTLTDPCLQGGNEHALAVGSTIRTVGANNHESGGNPAGAEYTLAGVYTGTDFTNPLVGLADNLLDGTRDATHNYAISGTGKVYSFGLSWQTPLLLFELPTLGTSSIWSGIAYDPTNNSLWVLDSNNATIEDYSLSGVFLSSFVQAFPPGTVPGGSGLALDPADQTLWTAFGGYGRGQFLLAQYSKGGTLLSSQTYSTLSSSVLPNGYATGFGASGIEFAFPTVTQISQTITFTQPADHNYGDAPFNLVATSDSSLTVSLASNSGSICTVSGVQVTLVAGGTCSITASQAGDANYAAATPVTKTFLVNPKTQTITFTQPADHNYGDAPFNLVATSDSGLTVAFASNSGTICTVSGVQVTLAAGGTCSITASQDGNTNYAAATQVTKTFQVNPKAQTITFTQPADHSFGDAPFNLVATSDAGLTVAFTSNSGTTCTVSGVQVTLVGGGTCSTTASQTGNANYAAATQVTKTFQVNLKPQTITFTQPADHTFGDAPFNLVATSDSSLTVGFTSNSGTICTVSGVQVTLVAGGTCSITASQAGDAGYAAATPVTKTFLINPKAQTITFTQPADHTYGDAPFNLVATSDSGLTVAFTSNSGTICTVSGVQVTLVGGGTCSITASQAGNANYTAATAVTKTFLVNPKAQTITFTQPADHSYGDAPFNLVATSDSGLTVAFTSNSGTICTVSGVQVTLVGGGTCSITASQAGNANYTAATQVTKTFQVNPKTQTITFAQPADHTFGDAPFNLVATSDSGLTVAFTSNSGSICTVSGVQVTLVGGGTCSIGASQAGNASYAAATPVTKTFLVNPKAQTITFTQPADHTFGDAPFNLVATSDSGLTVAFTSNSGSICTVSGSQVTMIGGGTCSITARQAGNANYTAATAVTKTFLVNPKAQSITFTQPADHTYGDAAFNLVATSDSGLTVAFTSNSGSICTVSGVQVTLVAGGTCSITARQAGNANYTAATAVTKTFLLNPKAQSITFTQPADHAYGDAAFNLVATSDSGLTVAFTSNSGSICTVSGSQVTMIGGGTCSITARQAGNANYTAATAVTKTFLVNPKAQSITFTQPADHTYGDAAFNLVATSDSGLTVAFTSNSGSICTVSGVQVTLVAGGTCSITARQAGNANYGAATAVTKSFLVNPKAQSITFGPLSNHLLAPFMVSAAASSDLTVSFVSQTMPVCTVSGTTVTLVAVGACAIQAIQAGNANYAAAAPVTQSFRVFANVSARVSVTQTGFVRNRATGIWSATMTVTNTSTSAIVGPVQVALTNLTVGVTMVNNAGMYSGSPYITVSAGNLAAGVSANVSIQFTNPSGGLINYTPVTYSGGL